MDEPEMLECVHCQRIYDFDGGYLWMAVHNESTVGLVNACSQECINALTVTGYRQATKAEIDLMKVRHGR